MSAQKVDFDDRVGFREYLIILSDNYYNGTPLLSDLEFDSLLQIYQERHGEFDYIRSAVTRGKKVELPIHMGSLDKLRDEAAIQNWCRKFGDANKVITPKIDGTSFLLQFLPNHQVNAFGNSTGGYGSQMNHIIPFLDLPRVELSDGQLLVRGELTVSKENFLRYQTLHPDKEYKNPLIWVTSIFTTDHKSMDGDKLGMLEFVAYEQMFPITDCTSARLENLRRMGFKTVPFEVVKGVSPDMLEERLEKALREYDYTVDGLVIYADTAYTLAKERNPAYAFAFKLHHFMEVRVTKVTWNFNRSRITPVIHFEPFNWKSYDFEKPKRYTKAGGHNARAIIDGRVGPGAVVQLRFNHPLWNWCQVVIRPSDNPSSGPPGDWSWNENKTEAIQVQESDEARIKKMEAFMKSLHIPNIKASTIRRLYDHGVVSVPQLLDMNAQELIDLEIEGFGKKSVESMVNGIRLGLQQAKLDELMVGSCLFGDIGNRKSKLLVDNLDIINLMTDMDLDHDEIYRSAIGISGIGPKMATVFADGLPKFADFLRQIRHHVPQLWRRQHAEEEIIDDDEEIPMESPQGEVREREPVPVLPGVIVLTDLKKKEEWSNRIRARGSRTEDSVTRKTQLLVVGDMGKVTTKRAKAEQYGIPIMSLEEFSKTYFYE